MEWNCKTKIGKNIKIIKLWDSHVRFFILMQFKLKIKSNDKEYYQNTNKEYPYKIK